MSSPPYTGPSVPDMIESHTLAENIIKYHEYPESARILDDSELSLLRQFVQHPENRDAILKNKGVTNAEECNGSLVTFLIFKHGNEDLLAESEIEALRKWFATHDI